MIHNPDTCRMPRLASLCLFTGHSLAHICFVADLHRLAPDQCSMLVLSGTGDVVPVEDCDLIARAEVAQASAFWALPFEVLPATRPDERLSCPAATPGRITVCVMPR